jgi:hypothetical protein
VIRPTTQLLALLAALFLAAASGAQRRPAPAAQQGPARSRAVEIVQNGSYPELHVDGKPFFVHSATFFYFRIPRDLWEQSLERHRALGINTIDLVIPWNWHEPRDGEFDFDGHTHPRRDLRALLRMITEKEFRLIARPGPVVGADWRHGGYPDWLLARPEYEMSAEARHAGRYPPLAELAERDSEAAAAGWLRNATHMEHAKKWLGAVARELAPYGSRQTHRIEVPGEKPGRTDTKQISGPLLFVQLGAANGSASSGPDSQRYFEALGEAMNTNGLDALRFANAGDSLALPGFLPAKGAALGEWFQRPAVPGGASGGRLRPLSTSDLARLEGSVERLKAQAALPPMLIGFQAGWLTQADDGRPLESDPTNTLLGSRLLMAHGAAGLNYFPLQDSLTPAGYGVPWAGRNYRWDAALDAGGNERARARFVARNGSWLLASGEQLAAAHKRADFGVVVSRAKFAQAGRTGAALQIGRIAQLSGLTAEWLDPERQPLEHFLRHPLLILPSVPGAPAELSHAAQAVLVEYVRQGGTLAVVQPRPAGAALDALWQEAGARESGRVIDVTKDFYSWVELEETAALLRMNGEFIGARQALLALLSQAGLRPILRRDVDEGATGELIITQLVSNAGSAPLGVRGSGQGFLSVTNLGDQPAEETLEILSPRSSVRSAGAGYIRLHVQVPPRESLLLPLHAPLCGEVHTGFQCRDELTAAGAELLKAERDGKTLELTLYAPARATLLLRLEAPPARVSLDEFRPEAEWNAGEKQLRVVLPRGAWPTFERVLKIRLPYTPHVAEAPKKPKRGRDDFDWRVVDAVRLPLGEDASLPTDPPLIVLDANRDGKMLVEGMNYDEFGRVLDVKVEGAVRAEDSVVMGGLETRQTPVTLKSGSAANSNGAAPADGLLRGELEVRSGKDRRRAQIRFVALPEEGPAHYRFDFDRDGADEWVLEDEATRVIASPELGGRIIALVHKEVLANLLSSVGGMFERFFADDGAEIPVWKPYAAEWVRSEKDAALRQRVSAGGREVTKTMRLAEDAVVVEYEVKPGEHPVVVEVLNSIPASGVFDRATQFCWKPAAPESASMPPAEPACAAFQARGEPLELPEDGRQMEVRTPDRGNLVMEWDAGRMRIEMKNHSALLRLRFPAASGPKALRQTVRVRAAPSR